jgi:hypothetical protein
VELGLELGCAGWRRPQRIDRHGEVAEAFDRGDESGGTGCLAQNARVERAAARRGFGAP